MRRGLPNRQQAAPARRQRGATKFEFALAAAAFAVLAGVAANRLNSYQEQIETVAAEQLITSLRGALTIKMSQLTAAQRRAEIAATATRIRSAGSMRNRRTTWANSIHPTKKSWRAGIGTSIAAIKPSCIC
jgi:hypothetical protein